jgi:uncharacterized repeat protein (TIGR01451 family)
VKNVVNDNGGTKTYADFHFNVSNGGPQNQTFNATTSPDGEKTVSLPTGTYSITEPEANTMGYATSYSSGCTSVSVVAGQTATCTITNNDVAPTLTLTKSVSNTHGGTATSANFQGKVDGNNVNWSSATAVSANQAHTLSEAALAGGSGYSASAWSCDGGNQNGSQITLALGQNVTCSITNSDIAPQLTVIKHVVNQYGGTSGANAFTMNVTGANVSNPSFAGSEAGTMVTLNAGAYSVSESGGPAGYVQTDATSDCSGSIAVGESKTCTLTNNDQPGTISGYKYEVDAGATAGGSHVAAIQNWTIYLLVNGQPITSTTTNASGQYTFGNVSWGTYTLAECLNAGDGCSTYTQIYGPNSSVTIDGNNLTSSSSANDFGNFKNGSISGYKFNDLNGDGVKQDNEPKLASWPFSYVFDANKDDMFNEQATNFVTDQDGNFTLTNLAPGKYQVCEDPQTGLGWVRTTPASSDCRTRTIDESGEAATGLVYGNQARGSIQVVKNVDTDGDGDVDIQGATDWTWDIDGAGNYATGSTENVAAGTYTISEDQKANYHVTASVCTGEQDASVSTSKSVTVGLAENVVCTFTNTRDTGNLVLKKKVVNDNGGKAEADDFTLHVKQGGVDVSNSPAAGSETGTNYTLVTGSYTVSEDTPVSGYAQTTVVCDGQETATVTVTSGQTKYCTITNDDIAPKLTVKKVVDNSGTNLTKTVADFTMNVDATNVSDNSFPGSVSGTTVTLDQGSYKVTEDLDGDYSVSYSADCDSTINVGQEKTCTVTNTAILKPAIHVEKDGPDQAHEGDIVTYTFTVTNPGNAPLGNVTVNDNVAGAGAYQSGDVSNIGWLDPGETWIYTTQYTIPAPQVANVDNTVTACGQDAADTQKCDTDTHTLDVLHPSISVVKSGPLYGYEGQLIGYSFVVTNTGDTTLMNVGINDDIADAETCEDSFLNPGEFTNCTAQYLIPIPTTSDVTNVVTASGTDPLQKTVTATDDHTLDVIHPAIHVVKSGPTQAHEGDTVTYTFTVTNPGDIALSYVTVTDNVAGNAVYQSGDTNSNSKLDTTETWVFTKDYTIPEKQTDNVVNTATACGYDPIQATQVLRIVISATCDTDDHTLDVLHPSLQVVKSGPDTAYEGDTVTYIFTVTNTGDTPLDVQTVNDDVAGAGVYQSGDTNDNDLLDLTETWIYTKDYTIPAGSEDILNTVKVCADDPLEQGTCGEDDHNTHVYHPMIKVKKVVYTSQESDDGTFNLQIDGVTKKTGGDGANTGKVLVTPGSHTVGETGAEGTDLSDYDTYISCYAVGGEYEGVPVNPTTHQVYVEGDQVVYCTIYNTRHAHLTVVKDAVPNDPQWFDFTLERENVCEQVERVSQLTDNSLVNECGSYETMDTFQLQDDTDASKASKMESVSSGWYKLTEAETAGWDLTDLNCGDLKVYVEGGTVWLHLDAGQDVTCTYTNTKRASVTIVKDARPNSLQLFKFSSTLGDDFSLMDDGTSNGSSKTFTNILPGTYTVTEQTVENWTLSGIDCGEGVTTRVSDNELTLVVEAGANVTCTFVNEQGEVLGEVTPPLVNTGESPYISLLVAGTVLVIALSLTAITRRDPSATAQ